MAITFISKDSGKTLLIGGSSTMAGASSGSVGPFPRYSVNREDVATGDGTYIRSKYTINITGTATLKTADDQNMLTAGQRQSTVQGEALIKAHFNRDEWPMMGNGKLTIASYGGLGNQLIFNDARLTSLELPEQNEDTAGVQNLEYSFTFEANQESSGASENTGTSGTPEAPHYLLASAEENWELAVSDERAFENNDMSGETTVDGKPSGTFLKAPLYKTYTLTHTVSAQGVKKFSSGSTLEDEAWRQAVNWVGTRLVTNPMVAQLLTKDLMGNEDGMPNEWTAFYMDANLDDNNLGINLFTDDYKAYNHVRQVTSDIATGNYSVTDTWTLSNNPANVTHDVEISIEQSQESNVINVSTKGTIKGLDTQVIGSGVVGGSGNHAIDKYENAKGALTAILSNAHSLARSAYDDAGYGGTLNSTVLAQNLSYNPVAGNITWDQSFNDEVFFASGTIKEDVSVTYDNLDGSNNIIAIIGVLGRASGPIIQDMGVTGERKVSVSVDYTMDKENRTAKPDGMEQALLHKPANGYQQSKTETWNAKNGIYNLSLAWAFNDNYYGLDEDPPFILPPGAL